MVPQPHPILEVFAELPDWRKPRGKRHLLSAILALSCCALWCGYRSYSTIADWGRNYGTAIAYALGFTHQTPCAATLHIIYRYSDRETFEAKLGTWAEGHLGATAEVSDVCDEAVAVDGETLRGSKKQGAAGPHLLSVLAHRVGLTLRQTAVDDQTNEIKAGETLLAHLVLHGQIVTMDAPLTQRRVAQTIVEQGGDDIMMVKDNQPKLKADLALVFTLPPWGDRQ
jgi:hypothetical protein